MATGLFMPFYFLNMQVLNNGKARKFLELQTLRYESS